MFNVQNIKEIEQKVKLLKTQGLIENIDFRIIYFSDKAELKFIDN